MRRITIGILASALAFGLSSAPAGADLVSHVSVDPHKGLTDGQMVTVSWHNFRGGHYTRVAAIQCSVSLPPGATTNVMDQVCDSSTETDVTAAPSGTAELLIKTGQVGTEEDLTCGTTRSDKKSCQVVFFEAKGVSVLHIAKTPIKFVVPG